MRIPGNTQKGGRVQSFYFSSRQASSLLSDLPVERIHPNPFNSRANYSPASITKLAESMKHAGQLSPVRVRRGRKIDEYELIYGHRRLFAAKTLGWKSIKGEILENVRDSEMIIHSFVENAERQDLSDFEKAMVFDKTKRLLGISYAEIGVIFGVSKQLVSNHLAMLRLFPPEDLESDAALKEALYQISEHHARVLLRVDDSGTRENLAKMVVNENLSVRELSKLMQRLRSWFMYSEPEGVESKNLSTDYEKYYRQEEMNGIRRVIDTEVGLCASKDSFERELASIYDREYALYSGIPPFTLLESERALTRERFFYECVVSSCKPSLEDIKINLLGNAAVATLTLILAIPHENGSVSARFRGTIVLVKRRSNWKIIHEHFSSLEERAPVSIRQQLDAAIPKETK
jgi:ParB/RepB/Spo0J family partition protein